MKTILLDLFIIVASSIALLTSCDTRPIHKIYAGTIAEKLDAKEDEWFYTYTIPTPQTNNSYIIDFYLFSYTKYSSQWYCYEIDKEITCEMLWSKSV